MLLKLFRAGRYSNYLPSPIGVTNAAEAEESKLNCYAIVTQKQLQSILCRHNFGEYKDEPIVLCTDIGNHLYFFLSDIELYGSLGVAISLYSSSVGPEDTFCFDMPVEEGDDINDGNKRFEIQLTFYIALQDPCGIQNRCPHLELQKAQDFCS